MQREYAALAGVEFYVMDVRELIKFPSESFSLVFDKACIDTLFCGTDFMTSTKKAIAEIYRVMKPESSFVSVSHGSPITRVPFFRVAPFAIDCYKVDAEIGEGLTLYTLLKTTNKALLGKKVLGGEMVTAADRSAATQDREQQTSKGVRGKKGRLTVTSNTDALEEMLAESTERDG